MKYNDIPNKEVFHVRHVFLDPNDNLGTVVVLIELDNGEAKMVRALVERIKFTIGIQKAFVDMSEHLWIVEELLLRRT